MLVTEALNKISAGALLVDVRTAEEFAAGHLNQALNIPHKQIAQRVAELGADKSREIVLYCRSGHRSGVALETLKKMGFTHLTNAGGYEDLSHALNQNQNK